MLFQCQGLVSEREFAPNGRMRCMGREKRAQKFQEDVRWARQPVSTVSTNSFGLINIIVYITFGGTSDDTMIAECVW